MSDGDPYQLSWIQRHSAFLFRWFFRRATKTFFREVRVVSSSESKTLEKPTLLIANHPNGLIDPLLLYCTANKTLRSVAKVTLWNQPVLRPFLFLAGAVPVSRKQDQKEIEQGIHDQALKISMSNQDTIDLVSRALCKDSFVIFPEGRSHDEPVMSAFKTGPARMLLTSARILMKERRKDFYMFQRSKEIVDPRELGFQPVGIYFNSKINFRSRALVHYGNRVSLGNILSDEEFELAEQSDIPPDNLVVKVTKVMEKSLREMLPEAEDEQTLLLIRRIAALFSRPYQKPGITSRYRWEVAVKKVVDEMKSVADQVKIRVTEEINGYFSELNDLGITDRLVRDIAENRNVVVKKAIKHQIIFWSLSLLLSPVIGIGFLLYYFPYRITGLAASKMAEDNAELSTYKFIVGIVAVIGFSVNYMVILTAINLFLLEPARALMFGLLLPPFSAYVALLFIEKFFMYKDELYYVMLPNIKHKIDELGAKRQNLISKLVELYEKNKLPV